MSRRDHVYCCECKRAPCICTQLMLMFIGALIVIVLACYGAYKLVT